ncbi:MAG: hypothetical protein ACW98D_19990, partial [Promethearchaeota archaeon]
MLITRLSKSFISITSLIFILSSIGCAQEDLKDKINNIQGNIDKVTISAGGQEYTFEGDDAKKLFKKMKSSKHSYMWHSEDGEFEVSEGKVIFMDEDGKEKVIEIHSGDNEDIDVFISRYGDEDSDMKKMHKKIKVKV